MDGEKPLSQPTQPTPPQQTAEKPPSAPEDLKSKNREELAKLAANVNEAPDLVRAARERALKDVKDFADEKGLDFAGPKNLAENPVFKKLGENLRVFISDGDESIPPKIYINWINAVMESLKNALEGYSGFLIGEITSEKIDSWFNDTKDINKGVGRLRDWFKKNYEKDFENWEKNKAQKTEGTRSLEKSKRTIKENFEKALAGLTTEVAAFPGIKRYADALRGDISKASTAEKLTELDLRATAFPLGTLVKGNYEKLSGLKTAIDSLPQNENNAALKTRREELERNLKEVSDETASQKIETDISSLEKDIGSARETAKQAGEQPDSGETTPAADWLLSYAEKVPDGNLKSTLMKIAALLTSIAISVSKIPWLGSKIRSSLVSDEILSEKGDDATKAQAKLRIAAKAEFKKFGLPKALAEEFGDKKTKDVVGILKKQISELKNEDEKKPKLEQLLSQLITKNGASSDKILFEFMGSPDWQSAIQYQSSAPQAPPVAQNAPANETKPAQSQSPPQEPPKGSDAAS